MATVHIVFGQQGAGKTTYSSTLADQEQGVRFSIDDWIGELYAPDLPNPINIAWIMERVQRCEQRIWAVASDVAQRGGNVVLDLGFMKVADRSRFVALAQAKSLSVRTHFVTTPLEIRRNRVLSRNVSKGDSFSFEVTPAMFDFMETQFQMPTESELSTSVVFNPQ
ncbi:AAA family ATPase [Methylomonas sp. 11b]|uniref:AAA family ATPase n=1 Tax=Methylomonas sp. 11b TaxID=1168169 RepID=UPI00047ECF89|nr:ATP-binding protein [Methylomonas sp. 11b]